MHCIIIVNIIYYFYILMHFRLTKEERINWINYLEKLCDNSVFSRKTLGIMFRSFHFNFPIFCTVCILFASNVTVGFVLLLLLFSYICWIPFNGCFLSMLENRMCDDDFNVSDPFLELFKLEKTKENRINISYAVGVSYSFLIYILLYIRYYI